MNLDKQEHTKQNIKLNFIINVTHLSRKILIEKQFSCGLLK